MDGLDTITQIFSIRTMRGFIKISKVVSKKEMKETIKKAVLGKYAQRFVEIDPFWK